LTAQNAKNLLAYDPKPHNINPHGCLLWKLETLCGGGTRDSERHAQERTSQVLWR